MPPIVGAGGAGQIHSRRIAHNRVKKKLGRLMASPKRGTPGPIYAGPGAYASSEPGGPGRPYCTTVTARRFCDQHEISLQMATGRSLPNDFEVIRCAFTPRLTR